MLVQASHARPAGTMLETEYARRRAPPIDPAMSAIAYSHSRTRTTSSNIFPAHFQSPAAPPNNYYPQTHLAQPHVQHQRRSPSVNTFSTNSSGGAPYRNSPSMDIRRSTSSRSGGAPGSPQQPGGYVALLRKQKATVWCDRAQQEDARLLAQQRMAKVRANSEVVGTNNSPSLGPVSAGRTSTGLSSAGGKVAAKIRHHGKPTVIGYSPGSNFNVVGGVPLRLSATEVEGEESEDEATIQRSNHRRQGSSSRSSTTSSRKTAPPYRSSGGLGQVTQGGGTRWSPHGTPERSGSLVEDTQGEQQFASEEAYGKAKSFASGSSGERLDTVPDLQANSAQVANNSARNASLTREKSLRTPDELKRRGSVDERTMTLTTGRLYIANPD
ncbi:uncharacterized protein QC763_208820 [Podospora pseudopauciseta]|uniref:Uncharacterized protein n=1 Tax=Podospora pseudopauciseta TaxID=2093780 RepID=A0ABR0HPT8_9PEZI|nr:hypothetical protein QC763_208820 [Podospora pseudopauciseta]